MSWDPDQIRADTVQAAWREVHERRKGQQDPPVGFLISRDQKDALRATPSSWIESYDAIGRMLLWGIPLCVIEEGAVPPSNLVDLRAAVQEG